MSGEGGDVLGELVTAGSHEYRNPFIKRTIQLVVSLSLFSFLISYFSGFTFLWSNNIQIPNLVMPFFVEALDRKYMFLICNGILAFLAKNMKTGFDCNGLVMNVVEDDVPRQINVGQLPDEILEEAVVQLEKVNNSMDYTETRHEKEEAVHEERAEELIERELQEQDSERGFDETEDQEFLLGSQDGEEDDDDDGGWKENRVLVEVSDASVSTEELNKKIEEFIRKMKEEIRIEANQHLITV